MSETVKYKGIAYICPRAGEETDKEYFERVTKCPWQTQWQIERGYEPDNMTEAIYDNNLSMKYFTVGNTLYTYLSLDKLDIESSYCNIRRDKHTAAIHFECQFYDGGASLSEVLEWEILNNKDI